jgi:hypothetical protein
MTVEQFVKNIFGESIACVLLSTASIRSYFLQITNALLQTKMLVMKKELFNCSKLYGFLSLLMIMCVCSLQSFAQGASVSGKVYNQKGEPLAGASVMIKGTGKGTKTDETGSFAINELTNTNVTLIFSYIGFTEKEIKIASGKTSSLSITLEEKAADNEEIIVTGVFDKRKKMEASVAITTINSTQISKLVSASAADLLKNVSWRLCKLCIG